MTPVSDSGGGIPMEGGELRERLVRAIAEGYTGEALHRIEEPALSMTLTCSEDAADAVLATLRAHWEERREEARIEAVAAMTDAVLNGATNDGPMLAALDAAAAVLFGTEETR